jgi:adenylate cyclase
MWETPRSAGFVVAACLLGLLALLFVPQATPIPHLEYWTADWRTAFFSDRIKADHPRIAVVVIDDTTLEPYPYLSPTDRSLLTGIVNAANIAQAAVVGLDFFFVKPTEIDKDEALVAALQPGPDRAKIVLGVADTRVRLNASQRAYQDTFLARIDQPQGYLNLKRDADEVVRYKPTPPDDGTLPDSFAQALARAVGAPTSDGTERIAWLVGGKAQSPFTIIRAENLIAAAKEPATEANAALLAKVKDRIVLVGVDRPFLDQHPTPLGVRTGEKMPGILVHAQMVAELLDGRRVRELSLGQTQLLVLGMWLAGCVLSFLASHHGFNFSRWTLGAILFVAIDMLLFSSWRLVLPFTLAMAAWVLGVTAGQFLTRLRRFQAAKQSPRGAS